jgi:hypothetical protein
MSSRKVNYPFEYSIDLYVGSVEDEFMKAQNAGRLERSAVIYQPYIYLILKTKI